MLNVRTLKEVSTVAVTLAINSSLGIHSSRIPTRTLVGRSPPQTQPKARKSYNRLLRISSHFSSTRLSGEQERKEKLHP